MSSVRSRFAPSPTGFLHIGGARTALFNHLFARGRGGAYVLRIEDTDRARSTTEAAVAILDGLRWLGLDWDEGPFFQTQRSDLYRAALDGLLAKGGAYRCYCTPDALDEKRQAARRDGRKALYDGTCRDRSDEPDTPFTVRFRAPRAGETRVDDLIRGNVIFQNAELDDFILARSDGTPTYNFVVVVDDADMRISHVIRGEDHLNNAPKQIQLYEALDAPVPRFAHLPLILGEDRARLSKRHRATSVTAYRDQGFFPEALVNYLARLGWSHGDDEIFSLEDLVGKFSVEAVGKSAGVFSPEKLAWVNAHWLKALPVERVVADLRPHLDAVGAASRDDAWLAKLVLALRERASTLGDLVAQAGAFLKDEIAIDEQAAAKFLTPESQELLRELAARLEAVATWEPDPIRQAFEGLIEERGLKLGKLAQPVRVAVTGGTTSPGIFETLVLVGRERTLQRLGRTAG